MSDSREYEDRPYTVRMPVGEELASSKATEGWNRGFTAKTGEKGPEFVEMRPMETTEETEAKLEINELLAMAVLLAMLKAGEMAAPHIKRWWLSRALPLLREGWAATKRRLSNRTSKKGSTVATEAILELAEPDDTEKAHAAFVRYETDMTSAEARQHLSELLVAQHFVNSKQRLLATARITDKKRLSQRLEDTVSALTANDVKKALMSILKSRPTFIAELHSVHKTRNAEMLDLGNEALRKALRLTTNIEPSETEK